MCPGNRRFLTDKFLKKRKLEIGGKSLVAYRVTMFTQRVVVQTVKFQSRQPSLCNQMKANEIEFLLHFNESIVPHELYELNLIYFPRPCEDFITL